MTILIAEDEPVARHMLTTTLERWGYEPVVYSNGSDAWARLEQDDPPQVAILDWMMPGMNGPDICLRIRQRPASAAPIYVILLTAKSERDAVVTGLDAGADDFVTKPFHAGELQARVRVGLRIVDLQARLADRVSELETALSRVKQLHGLLPICAYCKKIRDDQNYWSRVESYISKHADVQFSHGICPECYKAEIRKLDGPS